MCGDVQEGLELAVGAPYPEPAQAGLDSSTGWIETLDAPEMTAAEDADIDRLDRDRRERIGDTSIMPMADAFRRSHTDG